MTTVLIIDDSRFAAETIAQMLQLLDYQVETVYGPRQALESLAHQLPDVILTDLHMPGVEGADICRYIRRDPRWVNVPIIAMSSDTQPELLEKIKAAGANGFLAKPVELDSLEATLKEILNPLPHPAAPPAPSGSAPA